MQMGKEQWRMRNLNGEWENENAGWGNENGDWELGLGNG